MERLTDDPIPKDDRCSEQFLVDSLKSDSDSDTSSSPVSEDEYGLDTVEKVDTLIGGARVISNKVESASDDEQGTRNEKLLQSSNDNHHDIEKEQANVITLDSDDEDLDEIISYSHNGHYDSSHKTFSFSLPFGNTNFRSSSPLAIIRTVLPKTPDEFIRKNLRKNEIRQKLKKTKSISSLEEMELFKYEKGIDNSRIRAFKDSLEMDTLKNSIKQITADPFDKTHDGYYRSRLESIWHELEGDVVVMGGYRGSVLRDASTRKRIWIPLKAGLNMAKVDLLIGPNDEDELKTQKEIIPDGMVTHIGPVDVSKRLIKKLEANPNLKVQQFGYDWRLSLDISAEHLRSKLQNIYNEQKSKKGVYIIAHSMGGLVAHKVLQDCTHLIRGIIYVGSPSQCPNILGPIRFGDDVMWNKTIFSKETNFFMRSSFYFLPLDGRCFVDKTTLKRYDFNFFDTEVWKQLGLSPLVNEKRGKLADEKSSLLPKKSKSSLSLRATLSATTKFVLNAPVVRTVAGNNNRQPPKDVPSDEFFHTSYEDSCEYLTRTLERTKNYLDSLNYDPSKEYPPLAMVYGNKVPTVRGAKVNGIQDIKDGNYEDFYYGPGDGVVHHKWLLPEQRGFPVVCKIASSTGHVSLMTDFKSMAKAFISIVDSEKEKVKAH
ncbi:uncharacterized protein SKDI_10G2980 [Saccharomyces kudriavzevii IFO 1802]|uniref:YJR098C-like protein n=1 Tax=Saccharomyces kudriavzevii (strain ATCC MYA-4449 / AS 2.2408 / CBS 8840 / NBRC 1802 / NCYC 2889) TaxID=226230 RepID=A0AA35J1E6_SACK1|nr:uncharacterized protein SKDI_10G2980 [Saccharomyces kudriavzevii IFO 1802]CAI4043976.1 hypothetical protein SKDI_10G2980 [Saccharomyces kudriavzevii IFO 1802]